MQFLLDARVRVRESPTLSSRGEKIWCKEKVARTANWAPPTPRRTGRAPERRAEGTAAFHLAGVFNAQGLLHGENLLLPEQVRKPFF